MNTRDLDLWTKAIEKIDAGTPELLSDDEREVLEFFGGAAIVRAPGRPPVKSHPLDVIARKATRATEHTEPIPILWKSSAP